MSIATLRAFDPAWLYDEDIRRIVHEAIARLPEKTRRIFLMSRFGNKTYGEIADEVGLSVKHRISYVESAARAALRPRQVLFGYACTAELLQGLTGIIKCFQKKLLG